MAKDLLKKIGIGFTTGILCGLLASGGGLILVPCIAKYFNKSEKESRTTSIFCILTMVVTSIIVYHNLEKTDFKIAIYSAIGGVIGSTIGTKLLSKISDKILTAIFIIFTIYAAVMLLIKK